MENLNVKRIIRLQEASLETLKEDIIKIYWNIIFFLRDKLWNLGSVIKIERWFVDKLGNGYFRDYFSNTHSDIIKQWWDYKNCLWVIKINLSGWSIIISAENWQFRWKIEWVNFLDNFLDNTDQYSKIYLTEKINNLKEVENAYFNRKREKIIKSNKKIIEEVLKA